MPKDYSPLLDLLIVSRPGREHDRDRFKAALLSLDLYSVFDIIRLSRNDFIDRLAEYCDDDGGEAYDNAAGYASQIELLARDPSSLDDDTSRNRRSTITDPHTPPTYATLFPGNGDAFCSASSLAAVDSPAAYLRALYMFGLQIEQTGKGTQKKITLNRRRPTLKDLLIDDENTHRELPMLTLVNETLSEPIKKYLNDNRDLYGTRTVEQVLTELRYPFELPFDLAHQQCVLSLSGQKTQLGALNYLISLTLPYNQQLENKYGVVQQEAYEAQRLLTLLSPAQQNILTEKIYGQTPVNDTQPASFFKKHYGHSQPITDQQQFMLSTGLNTDQLHELLAMGRYLPRRSVHVLPIQEQMTTDQNVGARYINGPVVAGQKNLGLSSVTAEKMLLVQTTTQRYDRLQRMIRLQRWLDIPFFELDEFVHSVQGCEGTAIDSLVINNNTLRALGVFRYLSRRYNLKLQTFSAWLYHLPVYGTGQRAALFDQVFNPPYWLHSPLKLDNQPLDLNTTDAPLFRICAALGLEDTPVSFGLLKARTQLYLREPARNITTLTSLYRQATLPALFGLSIVECDQLVQMLGGADYQRQLVTPVLRSSNNNAPPDFLDVLMQLDWAVTWLKDSKTSITQLRQQLLLDTVLAPAPVQVRLTQLHNLLHGMQGYLLPQTTLDELELPQADGSAKHLALPWNLLLCKALLRAHMLLTKHPKLDVMEKSVEHAVERFTTLSMDPERNQELKTAAKQKLKTVLVKAFAQLQPLREEVERLLKDSSQASETYGLLKQSIRQTTRALANSLGSPDPKETLKHILLYLPNAEADLQISLSRMALQSFLLNPHWLDADLASTSTLNLALSTLYLFQRFNHFSLQYGANQDTLLIYFNQANPPTRPADVISLNAQSYLLLSEIMGWSAAEIELLSHRLPEKRVRSMAELDWLMRCHDAVIATGLSAKIVLLATGLTSNINSDDWKHVGVAALGTHPRSDHV